MHTRFSFQDRTPEALRHARIALLVALLALGASPRANAQAPASQVVSGGHHSCVVTPAGAVKCWGRNSEGQLGDGTNTASATPVQVAGLASGVVAVSLGDFHSCALTSAGGVKCWGWNLYGQLGVAGGDRDVPVDVPGLTQGVVAVESGEFHTCALNTSGGVKCWGNNFYGEIGDGTFSYPAPPRDVVGLAGGVRRIFSGYRHTCAALDDGSVRCWGANEQGQLGNATLAQNSASGGISVPVPVVAITGELREIAASRFHTCALTAAGAVECWGRNDAGQLGSGTITTSPSLYAVPVVGMASGVAHIDPGYSDTCAVLDVGAAECWGGNDHGQLGNGTANPSGVTLPVVMLGLASGVSQVSAAYQHTCVLTRGGSVRCAGANDDGRLGNGDPTPASDATTARPVVGFTASVEATDIAAGGMHACQLDTAGGVWCWGRNVEGQLGNGGSANSLLPVPVSGLTSGALAIATGGRHSCAIVPGGAVKCWGANDFGQLGIEGANQFTPVSVPGLTGITSLSAGWSHTCALTAAGAVKCWGDNARGQLGDGTETASPDPRLVSGLSAAAVAITAGASHTCAVLATRGAQCWGWNAGGQLGNGTLASNDVNGSIPTPVDVAGAGTPIDRLAAGGDHTCAVVSGAAKCWGRGDSGELGDGAGAGSLVPVGVAGLASGVLDIRAGSSHTCALLAGGRLRCWGADDDGQLGDGAVGPSSMTPAPVLGFEAGNAARLATGLEHTCALTTEGWARCWGENASGQLGDGTASDRSSQAEVMLRAQAVAFSPPVSLRVGAAVALTATAQSGLAPVFDSWTPSTCLVSGDTVVPVGAGLCGIRAMQAGDSRFFAAPSELRILAVGKGDQTIAFAALGAMPYGSRLVVAAAATSGLAVVFSSLTTSVCTVSGTTVSIVGTGTCTIAADQPGDGNYNAAARAAQSFSAVPADQAITFAPLSTKAVASPPFGVSATATSSLPVAFSSQSPSVCAVSGTTVALLAAGTCAIAADQAGNADYNPAPRVIQGFAVLADAGGLPRLYNISTRLRVLTGDNVMIAGFIIAGSAPKTVAIVTTGPSLAAFGITNPLADPTMRLVRQSDHVTIATNDNWQTDPNAAALKATGFAPPNPLESGLLVTLAPGAYTAIVAGANGGTGVALVGVYEVDHPEVPLINISTRGMVQTGDNVMIAGLIVQGTGPQKVLITATGPSLVPFGISNPLPNPTLTLVRQSDATVIATNDDWQSAPNANDILATGNAPGNPLESAILITLDPGGYTAIVSGAAGGTGVSLVGVYTVP